MISYESLLQILAASLGIIGAILVHHYQVRQEIKMRVAMERFERKAGVYRKLMQTLYRLVDFSMFFGEEMNWRTTRQLYGELVLVGSPDVIVSFNNFVKEWDPRKPGTDKLYFDVFYSIHQDLYHEALPPGSIKIINPPKPVIDFLEQQSKWTSQILAQGIRDWKELSEVDERSLSAKIGIPGDVLTRLKAIASDEVRREEERKKFFGEA